MESPTREIPLIVVIPVDICTYTRAVVARRPCLQPHSVLEWKQEDQVVR